MNSLNGLKHRLQHLCYTYVYGYKAKQQHNLSKNEFLAFKQLSKKMDIVFCKPDKSNGIVVLNTSEYYQKINSINSILNDHTKFTPLSNDPTERREASLQRYLKVLKSKGALSDEIYSRIRPCGSNASRIYGLPKLHKPGVPLRPIV